MLSSPAPLGGFDLGKRRIVRIASGAFAVEGFKFSLGVCAAIVGVMAMRSFGGEKWPWADRSEFLGTLLGLGAAWVVSAVRTISAAYREFRSSNGSH